MPAMRSCLAPTGREVPKALGDLCDIAVVTHALHLPTYPDKLVSGVTTSALKETGHRRITREPTGRNLATLVVCWRVSLAEMAGTLPCCETEPATLTQEVHQWCLNLV